MKDFRYSRGTNPTFIRTEKGVFRGSCNVARCLTPPATYFNQSTRAYYCVLCAMEINRVNKDSYELFGGPLCIEVSQFRDEGPGVIRYVVTHLDKDGQRALAHAQEGRFTYETPHPARQWIKDALANNSMDTLKSVYGFPLEVRPIECWPVHFDPKGIYTE